MKKLTSLLVLMALCAMQEMRRSWTLSKRLIKKIKDHLRVDAKGDVQGDTLKVTSIKQL
jgi:hypothetical protein